MSGIRVDVSSCKWSLLCTAVVDDQFSIIGFCSSAYALLNIISRSRFYEKVVFFQTNREKPEPVITI